MSFRNLHDVSVDQGDGTLVLHTSTGRWAVPTAEAALVCEVVKDRKTRWEHRIEAAVDRERRRYQDMVRSLAQTRATASTRDHSMSVTVDADGITTDIELTDRVRDRDPQAISADLMACIGRARAAVREQVQDIVLERYTAPGAPRGLDSAAIDRLAV
ncbi:YbaB/EbfC family nucleoid-associated protein [Lentzea sp. DG1S-22]|uniref:YbaB/EbfC family nucleoid-associated protein n=1 Tax=Lentzea sp. DG1S-22 TaxID=3108822 RepID=UPI002E7806F0|nr:YbaB/EbfC family nucleoid-associated protein [Lentzea sp. DG1S-22]WVH82963.1 YbaB/EbfC family nucleoid-associated protein [Lentzea sp. DG1S-22]